MLVAPTFHYMGNYPSFLSLSDFPSGLAYIAASLKRAGHEVYGVNPNNITGYVNAKYMIQDVLTKKIKEVQPELIGLGGLCIDYTFLRDTIAIVRREDSKIPIVLGGQIVSNDAEFIFDDLKPDYAIVGEADNAIVELVNILSNKVQPEPFIMKATTPDLDTLPLPDYEPFGVNEMLDKFSMSTRVLYRYPRPYPRPFSIVTSRSCPFACSFCVHGHERPKYRARSIENVMEEIRVTYEKYNFNILIILDELFAVHKKRMNEFCKALIEGKERFGWDFDWMFQTHANARLDAGSLKLAKEAGCFTFSYGLESASPAVLKSMNKKIKVEQVIEVMDLAREAKIGFGGNLIFGDIAETEETIAESLSFWLRYCGDNFVFLGNLMPYPGSKLFKDIREKGMLPDKKEYYENIDKAAPNMTQMSNGTLTSFLTLIKFLEETWLFVKSAKDVHYELEDSEFCKLWAECPYCGETSMYRVGTVAQKPPPALGLACIHCNRKIKVDVPNGAKVEAIYG